jgi:hypothetical protein
MGAVVPKVLLNLKKRCALSLLYPPFLGHSEMSVTLSQGGKGKISRCIGNGSRSPSDGDEKEGDKPVRP